MCCPRGTSAAIAINFGEKVFVVGGCVLKGGASFTESRLLYSVTSQTGLCGGHEGKGKIARNFVECFYAIGDSKNLVLRGRVLPFCS